MASLSDAQLPTSNGVNGYAVAALLLFCPFLPKLRQPALFRQVSFVIVTFHFVSCFFPCAHLGIVLSLAAFISRNPSPPAFLRLSRATTRLALQVLGPKKSAAMRDAGRIPTRSLLSFCRLDWITAYPFTDP